MMLKEAGLLTKIAARWRHYEAGICFPHLPATEFAPDLLAETELDSAILDRRPSFDLLQMVTKVLPYTNTNSHAPIGAIFHTERDNQI